VPELVDPSGVTEVLIAGAFWAGVALVGYWAWTQLRMAHSQRLTTRTTGDRHEAAATVDQAPTGAGSRSTR